MFSSAKDTLSRRASWVSRIRRSWTAFSCSRRQATEGNTSSALHHGLSMIYLSLMTVSSFFSNCVWVPWDEDLFGHLADVTSLGALPTHHFSPALLGLESVDRLLRRGDVLLKVMSQTALQHFKRLALAHLREIQLLLLLLDALVQLRHHLRGNATCWACVGHTRPQEQRSGVCLVQAGDGCTHLSAETC